MKNWIKKQYKKLLAILGISVALAFGGDINEISKIKLEEKYNLATEIKSKYQLDNASLVKVDVKNAELDKYKGEPKDEIKITLGDKDKTEFVPNIELKRWNEVSFKLKPKGLDTVATKDKDLTFVGDKVNFKTPKMDFEMYDIPATATDEGGYKYIWYLNAPPLTNKVEFQIETAGLDFFYQPALNVENTDPNLTCTETQCLDAGGNVVMERPENVVGSWAIYHKTKGGMNDANGKEYKTGKAFHIYRPHIIDANGAETWGILHIENGIYSVEIPQEFLDTAVYPIKSNDTFGYTSAGGSGDFQDDNILFGSVFTAMSGTITKLTASLGAGFGGNVKGVVVLASSEAIIANGVSSAVSMPFIQDWTDLTYVSSPSITAVDYILNVIFLDGFASASLYYDTGATNQGMIDTTNSYSSPTNPTDATYDTKKHSIYATYTPSGGGAVVPPKKGQIIFFE